MSRSGSSRCSYPEYLTDFIKENPQSWTRIRLNRLLLEAAYPKEIARSLGGVYPDREIYIPTPKDSEQCYTDYLSDATRRLQLNQLEPGEDVRVVGDKVQISGQVSVMSINGLLTKVIFDHNPKNEFFVEESFPLKWMYPLPDTLRDHHEDQPPAAARIDRGDREEGPRVLDTVCRSGSSATGSPMTPASRRSPPLWRRCISATTSEGSRATGSLSATTRRRRPFPSCAAALAGLYAWRINDPDNADPAVQQRMIKEADFAFRQSFAFCPYSPEAVFRYVNLLLALRRYDDALLIATTCQKLDPYNRQVIDVVKNLRNIKKQQAEMNPKQLSFAQMEKAVQDDPTNFQAAFNLAAAYLQVQQTDRALRVLDHVLNHPQAEADAFRALLLAYASMGNADGLRRTVAKLEAQTRANPTDFSAAIGLAEGYRDLQRPDAAIRTLDQVVSHPKVDAGTVLQAAQQYAAMTNYQRLETALELLAKLSPDKPEVWYDLASLKAVLGKQQDTLAALRHAVDLSARRLKRDAKARDLRADALKDPRFTSLRQTPEFKQLTAPR